MKHRQSSSAWGILALIGCAALYVLSKRFFPALTTPLLWIFGIVAVLVAALVGAVVFAAFHQPKKTPEQEKLEAQTEILKKARLTLMELRTSSMRVKNQQVHDGARQICATLDQILKALQEQPGDIPKARSFLNHSLPMLSGILRKYIRLEGSGVPADEVTEQTAACLRELEKAAEKQYRNLFENDMVDITADMQVLTQLCRQNGLLEEAFTQ